MYLKSIEVQGFKSFAHKIVFEFHNGITAIVGPNGSGKSNVADAVRWVLGEQSAKQLRGAKMEDVIFSGTESRKPQGFAYVSLTIDNSDHQLSVDYDEVTVARRVYRSGESEYLLNGASCRLKDVNELFYDTGIGKEGYSIIGQGQIDKILSGKPEERRELFDEAAGIVKFKRRKNEAVRKLESEKQNMVRVEDILSELEKQVGPLAKQAETAKEYLKLKEELKRYDINMFLLETASVKDQLKDTQEKISIAEADMETSKLSYEQTKASYRQTEEELEKNSVKGEELQSAISDVRMSKEKAEGEINLLHEQINSARAQEESRNQRLSSIEKDIEERTKEAEHYEQEKQGLETERKEAEEKQREAQQQLDEITAGLQTIVQKSEENRNRIIAILNEKANVGAKMQRYDTMLEQIQIRKAELSRKLLQYKSEEAIKEEGLDDLLKALASMQTDIEAVEQERQSLTEQISNLHIQNQTMEKQKNQLQQEYHTEKSRLESLRNLTERYDGYGNSIRKVMDRKTDMPGIIGVVADIIKAEKKYETAIETALGGSIQNIVTDKEETAKQLIEYLKKNKYGRATFLPLDGIGIGIGNRASVTNEKALHEDGVIGVASDLIEVEEQYRGIARHLLGRILVVDTIEHALMLAKKYQYSLRMVTLEGELLNPGGSMTGGAFKNSSNLLSRRREIEESEEKVQKILVSYERTQETIERGRRENEKNRMRLEELKGQLQEKYIKKNSAEMNLAHVKEEKENLAEEYSLVLQESKEIETQIQEIKKGNQEYQGQMEAYEDEQKRLESEIELMTTQAEKEKEEETTRSKHTETIRMEYSACLQRLQFITENLSRIKREMERLREEMETIQKSKNQAESEIQSKKDTIETIRVSIEETVQKQAELEERLLFISKEKETLSANQKAALTRREELSEHIAAMDKELYRLNSRKEKLDETLHAGVNYMWDEYEMTYREALELRNEELTNVSEMKKLVNSLKGHIKDLGTVNVNAIEDYKQVSERYEFLKAQHDDLKIAEETLLKIIEELDTGMRTQFLEKFGEIKAEFDKVFKELFGGGKGTIELVEEEDILEAGIRIISQPPGKKLQNMMQLSGGEKALTAIALLFAIQNLKPSPFCLLDEIEAALDDSNVGRYAKYLHKLTKHTQFIVITHRRGTMASADRLYGITMQEKGVSTLVSVDLIEPELEGTQKKN